jgi:hypothetical protein
MPPLGLLLHTFPLYPPLKVWVRTKVKVRVVTVMVEMGATELPSEGIISPRPLHVDSRLQQFVVEWDNLTEYQTISPKIIHTSVDQRGVSDSVYPTSSSLPVSSGCYSSGGYSSPGFIQTFCHFSTSTTTCFKTGINFSKPQSLVFYSLVFVVPPKSSDSWQLFVDLRASTLTSTLHSLNTSTLNVG